MESTLLATWLTGSAPGAGRRVSGRERLRALWLSPAGFAASVLASQAATMVAGLLALRWLSPEKMGLWQSLILFQSYVGILQGGVVNGLNRELPHALGRGELDLAKTLAATARTVAGAAALAVLVLALAALPFTPDADTRFCILGAAAGLAASLYRQYLGSTFRAGQEFARLATVQMIEAALAILSLPLIFYGGLRGFALRYALLALAGVLLMHRCRPLRRLPRFQVQALLAMLRTGIPIFACGYVMSVADTFPRLHLLRWGGTRAVGLFAPASVASMIAVSVCTALAQYLYPQMSYRLGQTNDPRAVWPIARRTAFGAMALIAPVAGLTVLGAGWALAVFFPAYVSSASAVRWMAVSAVFAGMGAAGNALLSLKAWRWLIVFAGGKLAFYWLLPLGGLRLAGDAAGLAMGVSAAEAALFVLGLFVIERASRRAMEAA